MACYRQSSLVVLFLLVTGNYFYESNMYTCEFLSRIYFFVPKFIPMNITYETVHGLKASTNLSYSTYNNT